MKACTYKVILALCSSHSRHFVQLYIKESGFGGDLNHSPEDCTTKPDYWISKPGLASSQFSASRERLGFYLAKSPW